jgi:acyl carrier protein
MADQKVFQQVAELAAAAYKVDAASITPETTFAELGKESMKMIALTSAVENELDVEVPIREVMGMKTFGEFVDRVEEDL